MTAKAPVDTRSKYVAEPPVDGAGLWVREHDGAVAFEVRVVPRASRQRASGVLGGALKVSLTAAPVEGAANAQLIAWIARALGVPKRAVEITRGQQSRQKRVRIQGVSAAFVQALAQRIESGHE